MAIGSRISAAFNVVGAQPILDTRYLQITNNLSDLGTVATARTNLGLVAGGTGDIWVEKAGDTMTGALNISLATGNSLIVDTTTLVVDATNDRVGIGTASPIGKLQVGASGVFVSAANINTLGVGVDQNAAYTLHINYNGFNDGVTQFRNLEVDNGKRGLVAFFEGSSGNVGIGTAGPSSPLHIVAAPVAGIGQAIFQGTGATDLVGVNLRKTGGTLNWTLGNDGADSGKFKIFKNDSTANTYLTIDTSGNVGVGTTGPAHKLEVRSDGTGASWAGRIALSNSSGDRQTFLGTYNSQSIVASHNYALNTWTSLYVNTVDGTSANSGNVVMGGNVGIGTASPGANLEVGGSNVAFGSGYGNLTVRTTDASGANLGGMLTFGGKWSGGEAEWAGIAGRKTNATVGEYGGYLSLGTRPTGGVVTERMRILEGGQVGVNISSTVGIFNIKTATNENLHFRAGSAIFGVGTMGIDNLNDAENALVPFGIRASTQHFMVTGNVTALFLASSGNVGINTTGPLAKAHVVHSGTVVASAGSDAVYDMAIEGPNRASTSSTSQLTIISNDTAGANSGGSIGFGAKYNGDSWANFAGIKGGKLLGAGASNYGGYLEFNTRPTAGASTVRMTIDANGLVGIGVADVTGYGSFAVRKALSVSGVNVSASFSDATNSTFDIRHGAYGTANLVDLSAQGGVLTLSAGSAERLRITTAGDVGIGTTGPFDKLDVAAAGAGTLGGRVVITNTSANASGNRAELGFKTGVDFSATYYAGAIAVQQTSAASNTTAMIFRLYGTDAGAAGLEKMRITSTGNVGIGTDNPSTALHIGGSGVLTFGTTAAGSGTIKLPNANEIRWRNAANSADAGIVVVDASDVLNVRNIVGATALWASNAEVVRVTGGNVGIGTTNPGRKLHITQAADAAYPTLGTAKGAFFIAGNTDLYGLYTGIHTTDGNTWMQAMRNDAATAYNILLNPVGGKVGIGTTDPLTALHVVGATTRTGSANNRAVDNKILYGATTDAATAVELTTDGAAGSGATNRIAVAANTAMSVVINIVVKQATSANAKQMLRQFVIVNNAGTTSIAGTVAVLGTDSGSAGLTTVTCTITANDTDDCIKVEVNGVVATALRFSCYCVSTEVLYA